MKDIETLKSTLSQIFSEHYFAVLATRARDHLHTGNRLTADGYLGIVTIDT